MVLSAINRGIKGLDRGALSAFTGYAIWGVSPSAFWVYGVRLRGVLVCTRISLCVFRVYGVRMWVSILCSIFRVFGKSTLLRFPGLRGVLKGIFWDLECLSGGKIWYFDVGLGGLIYLLFVVSR
jgi:hypothetical protein